jgi:hypothetical protein
MGEDEQERARTRRAFASTSSQLVDRLSASDYYHDDIHG